MRGIVRTPGLSIVEMLVVLALLAIVVGVGLVVLRPNVVHRDAAALAAAVRSVRWLAVTSGAHVAIVRGQDGSLFRHRADSSSCRAPTPVGAPIWTPTVPVVSTWPVGGLTFGPHGRPLRCDGSAVGNATLLLSGRDGARAAVVVASLGRVRWERR